MRYLGLILSVSLLAAALQAGEEPAVDRLAQLRDGYAATVTALADVDVASSKEYIKLPFIPPIVKLSPRYVPQHPGPYFYRFIKSGDKYGWWYYGRENNWRAAHPIDWTVTDGQLSLHVTDEKDNPNATEKGRGIRTAGKVGIDVDKGTPLFFVGWYNNASAVECLASESASVKEKPVVVAGVETWEVSARVPHYTVRYWLAPERSYLPVKVEMWADSGLLDRREMSEFQKLSNGVYFPTRVLETHFEAEKGEVAFQMYWKVVNVAVGGEVGEEVFSTSLDRVPEGFTIQDDAAQEKEESEEQDATAEEKKEASAETSAASVCCIMKEIERQ